jgi:hypothetical protein
MFNDIQTAIVARLQAKLPSGVTVTTMAELERVPEYRQKCPAVFVVYEGFAPADSNTNVPQIQQIELAFTAVVTCKNASKNGDPLPAQAEMDSLSAQVIEALIGYHIGQGKRLRLSAAPGAEYDAGYAYNPIGFTCLRTFKASA